MIPFVTKLLMSGQLKFEEGQMSIFGQRVLIFPLDMVKIFIEKSIEDESFSASIYDAAKKAVVSFCTNVSKKLNITKDEDMLDVLFKLTEMNGYGKIIPKKIDYENKFAVLELHGMPSQVLFGKYKDVKTADVYWCGLVAGGLSFVFRTNVDAVETRCVIAGKDSCEIVGGKMDYLEKELRENKIPRPSYLK